MAWIIIIGIILLILSITKPFFGLITYMAILYLRPMEVYPQLSVFPIARVFAIAIIIGFLIQPKGNFKNKIFLNFKQDKILIFLLVTIFLSCFVGWAPKCLEVFEQMAKNVILYALIVGVVFSEKRLKMLFWAILIMSAILGYNSFCEYKALTSTQQGYVRIGGFSGGYFGGSGDLAAMLNIAIPFGFFLGTAGRPIVLRPIALALTAACIAGMVSTLARGGLIAFGAIVLALAFFGFARKGIFRKFLSIALIVVSIVGIIAFTPSAFKDRAGSIADYSHQATATFRIEYWKLGIKMFLHNPILGVGAGNFPLRYWDFGGWERNWRVPHNMYIEALSELGILGFGCLVFLLYFTFKDGFFTNKLLKSNNKTDIFLFSANQAAIVSLIAYCVNGMFQSLFTYPMLYVIIGMVVAARNIAENNIGIKKVENTISN